jgi:hypothetical protein
MTVGLAATTLANKWLDMLSATAFTAPVAAYIKLHTADPGAAGTTAAAVGSATRVVITYAAASAGSKAMNGTLPVWTNGGTSETLTHISSWDAVTAGNFLFSAALTASQAWVSSNTFTLSSLSISLTPIAA